MPRSLRTKMSMMKDEVVEKHGQKFENQEIVMVECEKPLLAWWKAFASGAMTSLGINASGAMSSKEATSLVSEDLGSAHLSKHGGPFGSEKLSIG